MKTAEETLFAHGQAYFGEERTFEDFNKEIGSDPEMAFIFTAMKAYAKQVAEQALKDASERVFVDWSTQTLDKKSILETSIKVP